MNFSKYKKFYLRGGLKPKNTGSIKRLNFNLGKSLGKNFTGKITVYQRGGGVKKKFRLLNEANLRFLGVPFIVRDIYYDPYRTIFVSLIQFKTGHFCYLPSSSAMVKGGVYANESKFLKGGMINYLNSIPVGSHVFCINQNLSKKSIFSKAGGSYSKVLKKTDEFVTIRLPSGILRKFGLYSTAILGKPSNSLNNARKKYKAGTNRLLNKRPHVRGVAMNPVDHPHGGGEGKSSSGRPSVSPWGKLTKGVPTKKRISKFEII